VHGTANACAAHVIPVLVTGSQPSTGAGGSWELDPGNKRRDDNVEPLDRDFSRIGKTVNLRRDHVGGGLFVVGGALVLAVSGDLPFGTLASPGAGMMPKLVVGLMIAFGLILFARAGGSPPFASIAWDDLPHASRVVVTTAVAVALYTWLGFVATMSLLLFGLIFVVERRSLLPAAAFSVGVTVLAYVLFGTLLKSPLPRGDFWWF
jgi:Tripartite tricarboxylate transporter TctB family